MTAAGWDTAVRVFAFFGAVWTVSFGLFGALGLLYEHRHRKAIKARLDADVARMVERAPVLDEAEVDRWAVEFDIADPAVILAEAARGRPYDQEKDG